MNLDKNDSNIIDIAGLQTIINSKAMIDELQPDLFKYSSKRNKELSNHSEKILPIGDNKEFTKTRNLRERNKKL